MQAPPCEASFGASRSELALREFVFLDQAHDRWSLTEGPRFACVPGSQISCFNCASRFIYAGILASFVCALRASAPGLATVCLSASGWAPRAREGCCLHTRRGRIAPGAVPRAGGGGGLQVGKDGPDRFPNGRDR